MTSDPRISRRKRRRLVSGCSSSNNNANNATTTIENNNSSSSSNNGWTRSLSRLRRRLSNKKISKQQSDPVVKKQQANPQKNLAPNVPTIVVTLDSTTADLSDNPSAERVNPSADRANRSADRVKNRATVSPDVPTIVVTLDPTSADLSDNLSAEGFNLSADRVYPSADRVNPSADNRVYLSVPEINPITAADLPNDNIMAYSSLHESAGTTGVRKNQQPELPDNEDPYLNPVPSTSKGLVVASCEDRLEDSFEPLAVPEPGLKRDSSKKKRKTGLATVSIRPVVAFDVVEDGSGPDGQDEEDLERREDHENNNTLPNGEDISNINENRSSMLHKRSIMTLEQVRRMSDHTFQRFMDRFRRSSEVTLNHNDNDFKAAAARKMSVDSSGILKRPHLHHEDGPKLPRIRKAVSFSQQDNVRVFEASELELKGCQEDHQRHQEEEDLEEGGGRSLVPTFVYPGKKPNYGDDFRQSVLKLESMVITADFSLVGSIRVNLTMLKHLQTAGEKSRGQRLTVGVTYSTDGWVTKQETPAMLVRTFAHPQVTGLETQCLRFAIDCDHLEAGEVIELSLWCVDKSRPERVLYEDDNGKLLYKISCTQRLSSPWAMLAARQLNTFAPVVKFNKNYY